jgi:hypothetical protein
MTSGSKYTIRSSEVYRGRNNVATQTYSRRKPEPEFASQAVDHVIARMYRLTDRYLATQPGTQEARERLASLIHGA